MIYRNSFIPNLSDLIITVFQVSFCSYLFFLLLNILYPGFVSNYINLNYLLFLSVTSFIIFIFLNKQHGPDQMIFGKAFIISILCLGLLIVSSLTLQNSLTWTIVSLLYLILFLSFYLLSIK